MRRKTLTAEVVEEQKRERMLRLLDTRTLAEVFPEVERVQVDYVLIHSDAFDGLKVRPDLSLRLRRDSQCNFLIECMNMECTWGWFDLKNVVWDMVRAGETQRNDCEIVCPGTEAYDHPEQSCGCKLRFSIKIEYWK